MPDTTNEKFEFTPAQKEWLDALRSKKFKQCDGNLNRLDAYCCLGVACEVFGKRLGLVEREILEDEENGIYHAHKTYNGSSTELPEVVVKHLNLYGYLGDFREQKDMIDVYHHPYKCHTLADLNDLSGYTFEQIADFIEENPSLVFKN